MYFLVYRFFLREIKVKGKRVNAVFSVPLDQSLLDDLGKLNGQVLNDLKADMATALKNRVAVYTRVADA